MKRKNTLRVIFFVLLFFLFVFFAPGCQYFLIQPTLAPTPNLEKTMYWMVDDAVSRVSTQMMAEVQESFKTIVAQSAAKPPFLSGTGTPMPVATRMAVTVTSIAEAIRTRGGADAEPTAAPTLSCVEDMMFVADVTLPDFTSVAAGKPFTKTWKIKNTGTCLWNDRYHVVFSQGDQMGALDKIPFLKGKIVSPGDTIELSIYMTAPLDNGAYAGYWMLESDVGVKFGAGKKHDKALWVKVNVK